MPYKFPEASKITPAVGQGPVVAGAKTVQHRLRPRTICPATQFKNSAVTDVPALRRSSVQISGCVKDQAGFGSRSVSAV